MNKERNNDEKNDGKKATIGIEDFGQVQLRTAKVLVAEPHPDAERLLRLEVDLGSEQRQIVAGIADAYTPDELVGKTVIVVYNLKPAKLRGLKSEGMLLAATSPDGRTRIVTLDGELPAGAKIS